MDLGRQFKTLVYSAVFLTPLLLCAQPASVKAVTPANVYDRPLAFVYARTGGKAFGNKYTDDQLLNYFDQVPGGLTSLLPFFLNVENASVYEPFINRVKAKGIVIVPAVGQKPDGLIINSTEYKDIARIYRKYTNYMRLEGVQGYYEKYGAGPIQDMINFLTNQLDFKHIMLNAWPRLTTNDGVVPFRNVEVDATFNQVSLKFDRDTYEVDPTYPTNWYPGNPGKIDETAAYRPSVKIVINYENAPQELALQKLELQNGTSRAAMNTTITEVNKSPYDMYWCPPFSPNYDPIELGTWTWITRRLGEQQ